jgi:hypothetical protein
MTEIRHHRKTELKCKLPISYLTTDSVHSVFQ